MIAICSIQDAVAQHDVIKDFKTGCLSGDCVNGHGEYAYFERQFESGIFKSSPAVQIIHFKGEFENSKFKKGRLYYQIVDVDAKEIKTKNYVSTKVYEFKPKSKILTLADFHPDSYGYSGTFDKNNKFHGYGKLFLGVNYYEGFFVNGRFTVGKIEAVGIGDSIVSQTGYFKQNSYFLNYSLLYGTKVYGNGVQKTGVFDVKHKNGHLVCVDLVNGKMWEENKNLDNQNFDLINMQYEYAIHNPDKDVKSYELNIDLSTFMLASTEKEHILYTGESLNGKPHGKGVMINTDYISVGIRFFYAGDFKNGLPYGTGYMYAQQDSETLQSGYIVFKDNANPGYVDLKFDYSKSDINKLAAKKGFLVNGKLAGQVVVAYYRAGGIVSFVERYEGNMSDELFEGIVYVTSSRGSSKMTYEKGKAILKNGTPPAKSLVKGQIVWFAGDVAYVSSKNSNGDVTLSNNHVIPANSYDYYVTNINPADYRKPCPSCGGSGTKTVTRSSGNISTYTTKSYHTGSTIKGDYVKTTTHYISDKYQAQETCNVCKGAKTIVR